MTPVGPLAAVVLAQASRRAVEVCGAPSNQNYVCRRVLDATHNELVAKTADFLVEKPLRILVVLVVAGLVLRVLRRAIRRFVEHATDDAFQERLSEIRRRTGMGLLDTSPVVSARRAQRAEAIGAVLRSVATFSIWGFAGLTALGELGINLGPLIAGAGVAGVALGFGAQTLVRDFLSGIFMLVEDQYGIGDAVTIADVSGTVDGISLRTTRIRDLNGAVWFVPNGEIRKVGNRSQQWSRAVVDVPVPFEADVTAALEVVRRVAAGLWDDDAFRGTLVLEPPEVTGLEKLAPDGMTVRVAARTRPQDQARVERELRLRMKTALDDAGITRPPEAG